MQKRKRDPGAIGRTVQSYAEILERLPRDYTVVRDLIERSLRKDEVAFARTLSMGARIGKLCLQHLRLAAYVGAAALVAVRLWRGAHALPLPGPWWAWVLGLLYLGHLGWQFQASLDRFTRDE
jgi:hypothetical protein